jgi:hypothetical protein
MALKLTRAHNYVNCHCAEFNYVSKIILGVLLVVILIIIIVLSEILLSIIL